MSRARGSRPKEPPTNLARIARGLGGYTHQVVSHTPSAQGSGETWARPRPLLGIWRLEWAPNYQSTVVWARSTARTYGPEYRSLRISSALSNGHNVLAHWSNKVVHRVLEENSELCTESMATLTGVSRAPPHRSFLPLRCWRNLTADGLALCNFLPNLLCCMIGH